MRENIDTQARALFLEASNLDQALRLGLLENKEDRDKAQDRIEELSDMIEALYENGTCALTERAGTCRTARQE